MTREIHSVRAYQHLRKRLIAGDFEPGTRLRYGPIGQEIGVSATPVREAAGRLANEGLVELVPQLGAVVRKIDRRELIEIYEVRCVMEPAAAAFAAERASESDVARIEMQLREMTQAADKQCRSESTYASRSIMSRYDQSDYQFHVLILEATGNGSLVRTTMQSHVLTRVFGIRKHRHTADSMKQTCQEHQAILDAIRNRQPEQAREAAQRHIEMGLKWSLASIDES